MTGADESVTPQQLLAISDRYPFVEWAILVSPNSTGNRSRFPAMAWIESLIPYAKDLRLSLHLCGGYVNQILLGDPTFILEDLALIWHYFERVQINTHGEKHEYDAVKMGHLLNSKLCQGKEFIFQYDGVNYSALDAAEIYEVKCSTLFDMSHGAGVSPGEWPKHLPHIKCGYAGGIGPDNIVEEMARITAVSEDYDTWIDMETKVRSGTDKFFDLVKVNACLELFLTARNEEAHLAAKKLRQEKSAGNSSTPQTVGTAVDFLVSCINNDQGLYDAWIANLAVTFQDAYYNYFQPVGPDSGEVHETAQINAIANTAAANFLQLLQIRRPETPSEAVLLVSLSDKAQRYLNEVVYSLDDGEGTVTTPTAALNEILETNADFEENQGTSVSGWLHDKTEDPHPGE